MKFIFSVYLSFKVKHKLFIINIANNIQDENEKFPNFF